jgi:hypothetical protein
VSKVRTHQLAAVSIWLAGLVVLLVWGRSMAVDSDAVRLDREKFQGEWCASLVQVGPTLKLEGDSAANCRAEFDGKKVVFHHLVDDIDASGTVYLEKSGTTNRVDFKLDAGWIIGVYEWDGDNLKIAMNAFATPERLGVPTRPRPRLARPGEGHHYYEFHRSRAKDEAGPKPIR